MKTIRKTITGGVRSNNPKNITEGDTKYRE